jgi:hypothetical protein
MRTCGHGSQVGSWGRNGKSAVVWMEVYVILLIGTPRV